MLKRKPLGRIPIPSESEEQRILANWLRMRRIRFFSVPNGAMLGGRKYGLLSKLKSEGLLPGAPDLVLIDLSPKTERPVAIEMKRSRRAVLSKEQASVLSEMANAGWQVVVARGANEAIAVLMELGY